MFCVHVKSKEFKEACSRLNIHPSSLEIIVFQYLNNIDPRSFPSDEYIMSKLEGKAMTDASESQILLWEKAYSTPKVFSDRTSVGAFIKEASKYFSPDSISIHRNNEGQYVARVTKPENREAYEKEIKRILNNAPRNEKGQLLSPNGKPTKLSERQYAQVRTGAFKGWFGDWTKITQNEDGSWNIPDDVSKVIDSETGEPKIMYHGTPWGEFHVFKHFQPNTGDRTSPGELYFSTNKFWAESYTRGEFNKGNNMPKVYEVFLNIRNPYSQNETINSMTQLIEILHSFYDAINNDDIYSKISDEVIKNYNSNINSSYPTPYLTSYIYTTISNYYQDNLSEIEFNKFTERLIESKGKDGMIFLTGPELKGKPLTITDARRQMWVINSNQIKSATDNVGTYSTESDDIRFSFIGEIGAAAVDAHEEATTRLDNLGVARDMESAGKDALTIKQATGWERGADGKWRYEEMDYVTPETFTNFVEKIEKLGEDIEDLRLARNILSVISRIKNSLNNINHPIIQQYLKDEAKKLKISVSDILEGIDAYKEGKIQIEHLNIISDRVDSLRKRYSSAFTIEKLLGKNHIIFKAYPELKNYKLKIEEDTGQEYGGYFDESNKTLAIVNYKDSGIYEAETIVHEIQHFIQTKEGFTPGTNKNVEIDSPRFNRNAVRGIKDTTLEIPYEKYNSPLEEVLTEYEYLLNGLSIEAINIIQEYSKENKNNTTLRGLLTWINKEQKRKEKIGFSRYYRTAGEVEARNVAKRLKYSIEERRNSLALTTADVELKDQLFFENNMLISKGDVITFSEHRVMQNSINNILDYLTSSLIDNGRTPLVHKYKGSYYLTKGAFDGGNTQSVIDTYARSKEIILNHLIAEGIPTDAISFIDNDNSVMIVANPKGIQDAIKRNEESVKLGKLFESSEEAQKVLRVLNFLSNKTGLKYKVISEKEAIKIIGTGNGIRKVNAFVKGDTCYFIEGRQLNVDIAAEEMLHPFVASIRKSNPGAFNSLLKDAKKAFPKLRLEIEEAYKDRDPKEIEEEIVTQTLSRAFREDIKNTPEGHSVKELIKNFINRIVERFQSFFGENNSEVITEYKTRVEEILEREEITAQDLQSTITINELAEIVNSGLKLYSPNIEGTRMNVESSSEVETRTQNEEFMENNRALIAELENLYDLGLTDTDIKTLGTQLMYWISEHLTVLHNTPGELKRVYNIEDKDASTMSRKDIAELVTPKRLMEQCIREFRRPKEGMGWKERKRLNKIADNARLLLFLSSNTFTTLEGFSIIMPGADFGIMANIDVTTNEFNGTNEDVEIQEEEGSSIEHWIRANTTITLDERISLDVKTAISKCYRIGKDGKPVVKWGIKDRIPYEEARNIIVNICSGCLTLNMMVEALDNAKKDYPWLEQLIVQIKPSENKAENGARTQLQSAFFRDMYMARNAYSIVKKSGKKFESVIVNENTALKEITNSIITEFTIGSHPLFGEELGVASYNELVRLYNTIKDITEITEENKEEIINSLLGIYNHLGFYTINEDLVKSILTIENVKDITSSLKDLLLKIAEGYKTQKETGNKYYPFEYSIGKSAPNSILGNLRAILRIPASRIDNTTAFSVYDNGKMHQSFCTPSYLFKLMTKFQLKDSSKFSEFMDNEYKKYQWFAVDVNGKINYRASWLQEMVDDPNTREILKHKIQLNFNKHNYMRNMTSHEYALSVLAEFFSEKSKLKGRDTAWYRVPMLSNKPSSEFIRFVRYTGPMYKTTIAEALYKVYSQELSRIQTVRLRRQNPENVEYISNFDERGLEFCFLTFLNEHLGTDSTLGQIIERRLDGDNSLDLINQEKSKVIEAITNWLNTRCAEIIAKWEDNGILEKAGEIANIGDNKIEIKRNIENFIWNDVLASINIQELTITDPALYKDTEDIQKRIAQMHSPGIRPNTEAVDFDGNLVSDGNHRALTFKDPKDFEYVISNVIDNITVICDRKIAIAEANLKEGKGTAVEVEEAKAFKELLVGKDGLYRQIEVADAQAYSCATSYRKKAFMFGKWSKSAEAVYKKLINNEYVTLSDIKTAFQPLKPFVYSQISKSSGVADAPMQTLKTGIQNKNSEYLLVMAEAMLQNEDTGKPNLLRAISEFMEESAERFPTRGIDTVQFGSAVKVGKQVRLIDISKAESVEDAKEIMRSFVYPDYVRGTWDTYVPKDPDNPYTEKVDTMPMEDYSIQQEVPAHFRDHQQVEGSQERAIIPSDLPSVDAEGNPVTFATGYNIDGTPTGHMSSKEFAREWEETHALNIEESIEMIIQELQLDSLSKKDRNIAIARLLQREILANPNRYGTDLLIACSLTDSYDFRVPLGDPIQSKRVEQLLNSVVKNRINKQTIAGGPIVQVSNFGMSKRLSIRFNDKSGNVLDTFEEWSSKKENKGKSIAEYKKYIKENQAGIAYMECMAPAYTKELFANFADEDGNIDVEAIEKTSPELLKMIGYRIPTEDKYSISPLKIVGFLPRVAGDGIMLPYDITLINGSDFDIDKMYVMFKEYKVKKREYTKDSNIAKDIQHLVYEKLKEQELKANGRYNGEALKEKASIITKAFFSTGKKADKINIIGESLYKELGHYYRAHRYECVEPESPRAKRNNKIVDMAYAVMTHETTVDKALNPGGFEAQKHSGYLVEAFRKVVAQEGITDREKLLSKYRELEKLSVSELKKLAKTKSNLIFIDTQIQFYEQNNAAGALIGIFAVDKVAHAFLGNDGLTYHGIKKDRDFSIGGIQIRNGIDIDPILNRKGQYIGKILGSLVASAADAVKDPVLNLMNINGTTAATLCTMVRLGIPFETAALFLSSRTVKELLSIQAKENLTKFTTLSNVINRAIEALGINPNNTTLNNEDLTEEEMIIGLINPTNEIKYKTLRVLSSLLKINSDVKSLSFPTRMNSMAGAVGPLAIDNLILMHKLNKFPKEAFKNSEGQFIDINYIFDNHPMLKAFYKANDIADRLLKDIPANSMTFKNVIYSGGDIFAEIILSDRKLLSKLSDFYLSYILVSSGVINPKHTMHYITNFPKKYMEIIRSNPELKNNALIDAIKLDMDRKTKKPVLKVETTGASITLKERLMGGWTELVRNPNTRDLAIHLFRYNFFRGGVVFNPKTFMGLTTYQVKEAIPGYNEAYTRASIPLNECSHVVDLFIRNNWNEIKLVPQITDKKVIENILKDIERKDEKGIVNTRAYSGLDNTDYFKMEIDGNITLWKIIDRSNETDAITIMQVEPLGNNGEYLELSKDTITNALTETTESEEVEDSGDIIGDTHIQTSEGAADSYSENNSSTTTTGEILAEYEEAEYRLEGKKDLSKTRQLDHLVEVSAEQGVTLSRESIEEESKKYC